MLNILPLLRFLRAEPTPHKTFVVEPSSRERACSRGYELSWWLVIGGSTLVGLAAGFAVMAGLT